MNNKQAIRNKMLLKKASEYFKTNPGESSVVLKADLGESKIYWKVVKEDKNKFQITEVKTVVESYVFEVKDEKIEDKPKKKKNKKEEKA